MTGEHGAPVPTGRVARLAGWYAHHGRHELAWRATRDPWAVLVAEVMLQQTQVARVLDAWPAFLARFPDPATCAAAGPAAVIETWGRLGYPRRARRLWEAATVIAADGWPDDLTVLAGVGRYTAGAVAVLADGVGQVAPDTVAVDVNVRRVVERVRGRALGDAEAGREAARLAQPLRGRDALLALMDLGATVCRAREPACRSCPLHRRCASRGPRPGEARSRTAPFAGSFRQRRGRVLAVLRRGPAARGGLDGEALRSLVGDGLAEIDGTIARLPQR